MPDNLKKEFQTQTHKFLADLNEIQGIREGKTKLYIPEEQFEVVDNQKKDLVQRLESILIHWSREIKDIIASQIS